MKKLRWGFSFLVLMLASQPVLSQQTIGARSVSMGMVSSALTENDWALFGNPATISSEKLEIGFYGLRYYGFPEITDISSTATIPLNLGAAAFGFSRFGDELFAETNIRAGFNFQKERFNAGITLHYNHLSFGGDYGSGGAIGINLGVLFQVTDQFYLGSKARNINNPKYTFDVGDEDLASDLSVGFGYHMEEKATLFVDVVKDVRFPVSYRGGLEIEIVESFIGRVGISTEPVTYSFGFGYQHSRFDINLAVQQHEVLGMSPGLDMIVKL
ncbi:MAG: hypothetical protein JJ895_02605 [Balneolaceae bacterium]|nr:hypothetical protein [Balneolaceae bacterium]